MRKIDTLPVVVVLACLVLPNCSKHTTPEPEYTDVPAMQRASPVDLLFVIDNSNSMQEEQDVLVEQAELMFRELITPTLMSDGTEPPLIEDLHVGVVTTDMGVHGYTIMTCNNPMNGDDGELQAVGRFEGCQPTYSAPDCSRDECSWLTHSVEFPDNGFDPGNPPIWEDFGCIAALGTGGCGFEQQLEASHDALTEQLEPGGRNEGFLRQDSILAVIIVTDEDDCSTPNGELFNPRRDDYGPMCVRCPLNPDELHPIARYTDALRDLRPFDDDLLVVAAITGVPIDGSWSPGDPIEDLRSLQRVNPDNPNELIPSCMTSMGLAFPPPRLAEFIYSIGDAGILGSICRDDWSDTMMSIARAIRERMTFKCYVMPDDVDPAMDCRLIEIAEDGTERAIPHAGEGVDGWSIDSTARGCPSGQLQFSDGVEIDGEVRLECVVVEEE